MKTKPYANLHIEHYISMIDRLIPLISIVLGIGIAVALVSYLVVGAAIKTLNWRRLSKRKLVFWN